MRAHIARSTRGCRCFEKGQINVEHVLGVGLAAEQEEAHGVFAGPFNEVAQGHVAACAL